MGKIDELKDGLYHKFAPELRTGISIGFDAAMDLQLPVLFFSWVDINAGTISSQDGKVCYHYLHENFDDLKSEKYSTKELYDYWLENIYSPENK